MLQFLALVSGTPGPHTAHLDTYVTMFAPTNEALESYRGPKDHNFILNHLGESHLSIYYVLLSFLSFYPSLLLSPVRHVKIVKCCQIPPQHQEGLIQKRQTCVQNLPPNNSVVELYCI